MDITPPTDLFPLFSLQPELREESIIKLPYESILNICRTNKRLNDICKDPKFWKRKLSRDYPYEINEDELDKLDPSLYRDKYEQLYADEEYDNILSTRKIENMAKQDEKYKIATTNEQRNIISSIYRVRQGKRLDKLLEKINNKKLGQIYHRKYIEVIIPEKDINNAIKAINDGRTRILKDISGTNIRNLDEGNLVGLKTSKDKIPQMLIYSYRGEFDEEFEDVDLRDPEDRIYPLSLIKDMKKQGYTENDIPRIYNLPFSL